MTSTFPTITEAKTIIAEGGELNPGPWIDHSYYTGMAAREIADRIPEMDSEKAFILGYLHDIGRRFGKTGMRHGLDGYTFMYQQGFQDAARVCLSHCFVTKHISDVLGEKDCTPDEETFIQKWLDSNEFDLYDRLIQLCDCLALPHGYVLIEKRMVDVALRYGTPSILQRKWQKILENKTDFDERIGKSIYTVLPGIVKNSFPELYPE
ncbi:MAG: HD domain-containing protein [Anaerolineales bacterium]|nr:HD domain-containing protein [Anaerolineales bacterium]